MSRPSFPFYPDNYMNDAGVRRCSAATRGIWVDLLCLMHQGVPYGHLSGPGGDHPVKFLAQWCGEAPAVIKKSLEELRVNGVYSSTPSGTIFSRRMVRDEKNRLARGMGGAQSQKNGNVPRRKGILLNASEGILPNTVEGILPPGRGKEKDPGFESNTENQKLTARYAEFTESWKKPDQSGRVFACKDVDLGYAVWESLVRAGKITSENITDVFAGLERYRASEQWRTPKFITSVPAFLGWSKNGLPSAPKWNDFPAAAEPESEY